MKKYHTRDGVFTVFEPGDLVRIRHTYRGRELDYTGRVIGRSDTIEGAWRPHYRVEGNDGWVRFDHISEATQ